MDPTLPARLEQAIRTVPDFPREKILFRDITTLLARPGLMREAVEAIYEPFAGRLDAIAGIESRGFIVGAGLAWMRELPFVPLRKPGKLPAATWKETYVLEYGVDALEVHQDGFLPGQRVLIVDDLLATGGTASAAARLIEKAGARVAGLGFLIELDFLHGRGKLPGYTIQSLVHYGTE